MRGSPLKYLLDLNDSGIWGNDPTGEHDTVVLRSTDISLDGSWRIHDPAVRHVSGIDKVRKRLACGDIVVVKSSGSPEHLGKSAIVTEEVAAMGPCFANFVQRLRPSTSADSRYMWYVLNSKWAADEMASLGNTTTGLRNLNGTIIGSIRIPVTRISHQRAIADYLDIETGRIDALISKKRRMIGLLKQRWRAEVMSTVYGDDSVRWGAIRYVVDLLPGYAFPSSSFVDEGVRLLRGANIAPGRLRWDTNVVCLSPEDRPQLSEYELAEGDLVLGMDRPVIGAGMRVALVTASDLPCLLVQRVARIRATTRADAEYIRVLIESDAFVAYFSPITTGVSVPHISGDQILSFRAPLPSYDVQHALATRLHRERTRLTAMSNRLTAQIVLLAERRQALITTAVTGELAIRGMAG